MNMKLTNEDIHNLYDLLFFIIDETTEYKQNLKLNKMDKWYENFRCKIQDIAVPELKEEVNKFIKKYES